MKALDATTPLHLGRRAALVALAAGLGGALWVIGDAAAPVHLGPLGPPAAPTAALVPAAWTFEPTAWHGLAGLPARLGSMGLHWPGFLLALLLVAGAALAIIHPGAFQRPAPYRLPRSRAIIAYVSALLIGMALPATVLLVANLVGPGSAPAFTAAMRVCFGVVAFCACLWTLAGQDIWHPRALVRFTHGGMAGFGIAGVFTIAALLLLPFEPVVDAGAVAAAIRDLGQGSPGSTWGTVLGWRLVLVGLAFAAAGAVAVMAGPQSVGSPPRLGAGVVALVTTVLLVAAGAAAARSAGTLARDLDPEVVAELQLTVGPPRFVALLSGDGRVTVGTAAAMEAGRECAGAEGAVPAPSDENLQRVRAALASTGGAVSVRASRLLACLAVLHALRFEPDAAAAALFDDPAPGRLPLATLGAAARGVVDRSQAPAARRWLGSIADSIRFTGSGAVGTTLRRRLGAPPESAATVEGILAVAAPTRWRVALVRGVPTGAAAPAASRTPLTGERILQSMAVAATPDAAGRFVLAGVPAGTWQVALLAPEGTAARDIAALSVRNDPGQFSVLAADRRDLGTIRLSR